MKNVIFFQVIFWPAHSYLIKDNIENENSNLNTNHVHWMTPCRQIAAQMLHSFTLFHDGDKTSSRRFTVNILFSKICTSKHIKTNYREENTWVCTSDYQTYYRSLVLKNWRCKELGNSRLRRHFLCGNHRHPTLYNVILHLHDKADPAGLFLPQL